MLALLPRGCRHFLENSGSLRQVRDNFCQALPWSHILCHSLAAAFHLVKKLYPLYAAENRFMTFGLTQQPWTV